MDPDLDAAFVAFLAPESGSHLNGQPIA